MAYTTKCVRCLKPAKVWGGHVTGGPRSLILAGWCSDRCSDASNYGFVGRWSRSLGLQSRFKPLKGKGRK